MDTDLRRSPTLTNRLRAGLVSLAEVRVMAFVGDPTAVQVAGLPRCDNYDGLYHITCCGRHDTATWLKRLQRLVTDCPNPQRLGVVVAVAAAGTVALRVAGEPSDHEARWAVIEAARAWLAEPTEDRLHDWDDAIVVGGEAWLPTIQLPWQAAREAARLTDIRPSVCTALLTELQSRPASG